MGKWSIACRIYPLVLRRSGVYCRPTVAQDNVPERSGRKVAHMDATKTLAPDKHQAHIFEPSPAVPLNPRAAATSQEAAVPEGADSAHTSESNCSLCGAPRNDQIHINGKAEADDESPRWGL